MIEEKNAKITHTFLGVEDHGHFTFFLHLDYGNSSQGAGGYILTDRTFGIIKRILHLVGVEKWEELPGKHIKVKADDGKVFAIQNILGGEWLDFGEYFKRRQL